MQRRTFLGCAGTGMLVSLSRSCPGFLARAAAAAESDSANGNVLVLVELAGGNDGLNTVVPYADDAYYKARPGIAVPRGAVLKLDDYLGFHPQMTGFRELYDAGNLAIVQGVGYPQPNRSHFRSMDIWHSARPETEYTRDGWVGRALDERADEYSGQLPALALGTGRRPLALVGSEVNVPTIRRLNEYRLKGGPGSPADRKRHLRLLRELADQPAEDAPELAFLRRTTQTAVSSARRLQEVKGAYQPAASYPPNSLARKLKLVAQMIAGGLETRIVFVSLGGFDTHSQQQGAHQALLGELSAAVRAFFSDLQGHGLDERVLLATFSEFGRRVGENGSLGTDHGAAAPLFVAGPAASGGLHGEHPSLTELTRGDLQFHTDFRSVYATLLKRWLDIPGRPVLAGEFPLLDFV